MLAYVLCTCVSDLPGGKLLEYCLLSATQQMICFIKAYHDYKNMWVAMDGKELSWWRGPSYQLENWLAVVVIKDSNIVRHMLEKQYQFVNCY